MSSARSLLACEKRRKVGIARLAIAAVLLGGGGWGSVVAVARPLVGHAQQAEPVASQPTPAVEPGEFKTGRAEQPPLEEAKEAGPGEREGEEGLFSTIARLINAAILFGTLYYFLRKPVAEYLADRQKQVRQDLVTAADLRNAAAEQLEALDRKMRALPREIETLKAQGAEEIAQEQARISQAADAERQRLLEQTRREIGLQLRIAQRDLVEHAADLAIGLATERIKKNITDQDQARLVDRYVEQLKK